jgi:hypothetical protein
MLNLHFTEETDFLIDSLIFELEKISKNERVNDIRANESCICYFESEMDLISIHTILANKIDRLDVLAILSEVSDKMSVHMSEEVSQHLFDLESEVDESYDIPGLEGEIDFSDDFAVQLLEEVRRQIKTPTLDDLLDKIKVGGMSSLSPFEKGVLETYSKN